MNKRQVVIFVADSNYVDHVKSLAVNCREHGNYKGDFAVICPTGSDIKKEFEPYGFHILERGSTTFFQKFFVFDEYFKRWDSACYMDCDIIIQDDMQRLFDLLNNDGKYIYMDTEDGSTMLSFWRDTKANEHKDVYDWMRTNYPHVDSQTFNSSVIVFKPESIPANAPQTLIWIQNQIEKVNSAVEGGTDQQTINLLLAPQCKRIPSKLSTFWGLAEPQNDVVSETRGWVGGEVPVAIHYTRWYAMWNKKTPDADAYLIRKFNMPTFEFYHQNLEKFKDLPKSTAELPPMTLGELFNHFGSDKESGHLYAQYYEKHLPKKVNKLVEIGAWKGSGITAFKEYYKSEGTFYSLDRFILGHGLITMGELMARKIVPIQGDHDDFTFLKSIKEQFTVIVDDGSHHWKSQINLFKKLFENNMESGGVYVCEDIFDDAYWGQGLIKKKEQNIKGLLEKYQRGESMASDFISEYESITLASMIDEVFIYDNIVFVTKK